MNIYWEIFGYCGTALVLLSMMMSSVVKLRIFNTIGSLICVIYSIVGGAWPVVALNGGLIIINVVQLIRLGNTKVIFTHEKPGQEEMGLVHFLHYYKKDIAQYFPDFSFRPEENTVIYMVYAGAEPAGVFVGKRQETELRVELDYATPAYRDCSVGTYLYGQLKAMGYTSLSVATGVKHHDQYLKKMGFVQKGDDYIKNL